MMLMIMVIMMIIMVVYQEDRIYHTDHNHSHLLCIIIHYLLFVDTSYTAPTSFMLLELLSGSVMHCIRLTAILLIHSIINCAYYTYPGPGALGARVMPLDAIWQAILGELYHIYHFPYHLSYLSSFYISVHPCIHLSSILISSTHLSIHPSITTITHLSLILYYHVSIISIYLSSIIPIIYLSIYPKGITFHYTTGHLLEAHYQECCQILKARFGDLLRQVAFNSIIIIKLELVYICSMLYYYPILSYTTLCYSIQ